MAALRAAAQQHDRLARSRRLAGAQNVGVLVYLLGGMRHVCV